ncbi:MAG: peptidase domain-containing ABC transporter [Bacteroidota bacterium]|nr:MAG: peptidase domain-containing ABC transporter [Bacteroidota bacterium]
MKKRIASFPFIKQPGMMECGTTSLAIIFKYYGYYDIRAFLTEKAGITSEGVDLYTLSELAEGFGFETEGYKLEYKLLGQVHLPAIAHYDGNHFVVVYKHTAEKVWISDPAIGKYTLSREEFNARWNGVVLVLNPTSEIFKHNELTELAEEYRHKRKSILTKYYLPALLTSRKYLVPVLLGTLVLQFLGLALPFFTQTIIDQVLVNNNLKLLYAILVGMIAIFLSQVVLTYGRNILLTQFKVNFERSFFSRFFDHFIHLKISYFDSHKREDFINRFQENLRIRAALNPSILQGFIDSAFVVIYLLVLFFYSMPLALLSLGFVVVYIVLTMVYTPRLKNLENRIFGEDLKTMGQFLDTLLGMQTVRLLGIEKLKFWKWKNQYTKALNKVLQTEKTYISLSTLLSATFYLSQAFIYWYGAYLTFNSQLTIGQYVGFVTIFTIVIHALSRITQIWFILTELSVSFDRLNDILIQEEADFSFENKVRVKNLFPVRFKKVSFRYREQDENYALRHIDVEIPQGSFVGIVGRNGSGKSTFVKLLCKLYDNYEGEIRLHNTELRHVMRTQLRKNIAMVPQDIFLFKGTIFENIQLGNPDATEEEILEAAKAADLSDFIDGLYLGYNTMIGDSGSNLSGGQRNKIALARLFVANPEIIVIDEASSALDIETEKRIMDKLKEKFKGKTIISVAHRIHTLRNADLILVFDKGAIVEQGSHADLIAQKGLYASFIETYIHY